MRALFTVQPSTGHFHPLVPVTRAMDVPQPLLLRHCDAFITDAGFNSVKEALSAGIPMSRSLSVPTSPTAPSAARSWARRKRSAPITALPTRSETR